MLDFCQKISNRKINIWIFLVLLSLLIIDKILSLLYFGFVYTDIDQLVMWNGATDYSRGIFHEPFFYGQPFNYMLESFVAAPLLYFNVPVYMALPIATSSMSLLPYIVLGYIFFKKQHYFWAYLVLSIPVFLPLEYSFLTSMSRGFIQAHLFIPILFVPIFFSEKKYSIDFLYIGSALCFVANPSSILIIFPVFIYVLMSHYHSISFYLKSLWTLPFFILNFLSKSFYKNHPERVLHDITGLEFDFEIFIKSLSNPNLFENLYPFSSSGGAFYLLIFVMLTILAMLKSEKKVSPFTLSIIFIIFITLNIPKVQEPYPIENAGVFFTVSRLFLVLPILVVLSFYLLFKDSNLRWKSSLLVLGICIFSIFIKNNSIQKVVDETVAQTSFPIAKNKDLINRSQKLKILINEYNLDLLVHQMSPSWDWSNLYDSYALYPLIHKELKKNKNVISVNLNGDRRSWLYEESKYCKNILLIGLDVDENLLKDHDYEILEGGYIFIKNNKVNTNHLFQILNLNYGIIPLD